MSDPKPKDPLIQLPLSEYLDSHLGELQFRPVSKKRAELIEAISDNLLVCKVVWEDEFGSALERPLLWRYKAWFESSEREAKIKARSQMQRVQRFIFDANVKMVTKQLREELMFDESHATTLAFNLVTFKKSQQLKAIGVNKLIEREDELP